VTGIASEAFRGRIARTIDESEAWWPEPAGPPAGTPNVVFVVLDDVGYADFGCYGSELHTPTVDRLARDGLRYTNFHTTTLCSPTRASLLTGRNHHAVGMRMLSNLDTGFPSGRGRISHSAATIAEILLDAGFSTMCAGKWHLAPSEQTTAAGPFDQWPLGRGFERYYGFLGAETDSFFPELTADNHHVDPPAGPADGYHLTTDLVDRAIGFVRDQTSVTPDKPFFLHLAFGAAHAPHQAPEEYLRRQRGRFDAGWDDLRTSRLRRQIELGLLPAGTVAAPRNPGVAAWDDLSADERRLATRLQEAYAAMVEHTDHELGRFVSFLERIGRLRNTILILLSDNGASQEGGAQGSLNTTAYQNGIAEDLSANVERLEQIGGPQAQPNYPWGWAQVSNTPFKRYKQNTHEGGIRDPLVVHWPGGIDVAGQLRHQFHHVIDITPTVLALLGISPPESRRGVPQMPMHGIDMSYTFADPDAESRRRTQHFEMFGHRAIYHDGDKAVTFHQRGAGYDDDAWELYHLPTDPTECHDRSAEDPGRLAELVELFWQQAEQFGVLPLDDKRFAVRAKIPRPGSPRARTRFTYYPGMSHLPVAAAPPTMDRDHTITVDIDRDRPSDSGVLVALGGVSSGYVLYVKEGQLRFDYNFLGTHYRIRSAQRLPTGRCVVGFRFTVTGPAAGFGELLVDDAVVDRADFPRVLPDFLGWEGLDIGRDALSPVCQDYAGEFPFTGRIGIVVFDLPEADAPVPPEPVD
jgi:arylsulfatase